MLLTEQKIRTARPEGKEYRIRDGDGLFLVVRPSGSKSWQLRYEFADKEKSLSFGKYPEVSLLEARERKTDARRLLRDNIDPSAYRKKAKLLVAYKSRHSFEAVAKEWFERSKPDWTARHAKRTWRRLELHVIPTLGMRPIAEIEPVELLVTIQAIEADGAGYTSHRILQICGSVFNYAIITGRISQNVSRGLSKALRPCRSSNYPCLEDHEIAGFLSALNGLNTSDQNRLAFELLLLTALRTGELRRSKWSDIDFEGEVWKVRAEIMKMKRHHLVPLSKQSLGLLYQLKEITGSSEWLFPSQQKQVHPIMSENTINSMIKRMGYKGRIVGHGFRSMFSTIANENGFNRDAIERQLAHLERNKVRAAYNRAEYIDERRKLMQWWADFIDSKKANQKRNPAVSDESPLSPEQHVSFIAGVNLYLVI